LNCGAAAPAVPAAVRMRVKRKPRRAGRFMAEVV
jgi:hypothetical protein